MSTPSQEEEFYTFRDDFIYEFKKGYLEHCGSMPSDDECDEAWEEYLEGDVRIGEE